jgi:hypothetical protein
MPKEEEMEKKANRAGGFSDALDHMEKVLRRSKM